jgi:hypothetical protein
MLRFCLLLLFVPLMLRADCQSDAGWNGDIQNDAGWIVNMDDTTEDVVIDTDEVLAQYDNTGIIKNGGNTNKKYRPYSVGGNANARKHNLVVGAQFLYFGIDEAGLNYAISKDFPVFVSGSDRQDGLAGTVHRAKFEWTPAFRISAGCNFVDEAWNILAEYTQIYSSNNDNGVLPYASDNTSNTSNSQIVGTFPQFISKLNKAESHIKLKYNVADLTAVKPFYLTNDIHMNFFVGARTAFIHQKWNVRYLDISGRNTLVNNNWIYKAGGINTGVFCNVALYEWLSLFAKTGISALHGYYGVNMNTLASAQPTRMVQQISPDYSKTVMTTQMDIGLSCKKEWNKVFLTLFACYEFNTWYNLAEIYRFSGAKLNSYEEKGVMLTNENLNLQGLVLGLTFKY